MKNICRLIFYSYTCFILKLFVGKIYFSLIVGISVFNTIIIIVFVIIVTITVTTKTITITIIINIIVVVVIPASNLTKVSPKTVLLLIFICLTIVNISQAFFLFSQFISAIHIYGNYRTSRKQIPVKKKQKIPYDGIQIEINKHFDVKISSKVKTITTSP